MAARRLGASLFVIAACVSLAGEGSRCEAETTQTADATLDRRVAAQLALEKVYHAHVEGVHRRLDEAAARAGAQERVETYLRKNQALEERWHLVITDAMLAREVDRIRLHSRLPDRLEELFAALGHDETAIREFLVRPLLVDRLVRAAFASDHEIHRAASREIADLKEALASGRLSPHVTHPRRRVVEWSAAEVGDERLRELGESLDASRRGDLTIEETPDRFVLRVLLSQERTLITVANYSVAKATWDDWWDANCDRFRPVEPQGARVEALGTGSTTAASTPCLPDNTWYALGDPDAPNPRSGHSAVWTGTHMIVWGGSGGNALVRDDGAKYDPVLDTWIPIAVWRAKPYPRSGQSTIWTGDRMVIWGGYGEGGALLSDGNSYDPVSDTWAPISVIGAPEARARHSVVWTGSEMIIWGGNTSAGPTSTGGRYAPSTDTWTPVASNGAPTARYAHSAVWTGSSMVVWGGKSSSSPLASGARYDPASNAWAPITNVGAPLARSGHSSVWTGSRMIVWAGSTDSSVETNTGAEYDPIADRWSALPTTGAPSARVSHVAEWTGSRMLVWGGEYHNLGTFYTNSGGAYDPVDRVWTSLDTVWAPRARASSSAVWTGTELIVWGGRAPALLNTGGRYDPRNDRWTPTRVAVATARARHSAVWTGSHMIVWGGDDRLDGDFLDSGDRYDPTLDAWMPITRRHAPSARRQHTAIWTGTEMIVWGGAESELSYLATGGRYDPLADAWSAVSDVDAPSARQNHVAVWTGREMIVWGGGGYALGSFVNSGGRYDPATDLWSAVTLTSAPTPRTNHEAVWTGSELIVWGGYDNASFRLDTGGRYDPIGDRWTPTSMLGAPPPREEFVAVWAGNRMIVWGGTADATGGRYDPVSDTWAPTTLFGVPVGRMSPRAVSTGTRMVVWGGFWGGDQKDTGGIYDPLVDVWTSTASVGAPYRRVEHSAVWIGSSMLVWGGEAAASPMNGGAQLALAQSTDNDGDGLSSCQGDCNDGSASTFPGAAEVCDLSDNDCDGEIDEDYPLPGAVGPIVFVGRDEIEWNPVTDGERYDVVLGELPRLRQAHGRFSDVGILCVADDDVNAGAVVGELPPTVRGSSTSSELRTRVEPAPSETTPKGGHAIST